MIPTGPTLPTGPSGPSYPSHARNVKRKHRGAYKNNATAHDATTACIVLRNVAPGRGNPFPVGAGNLPEGDKNGPPDSMSYPPRNAKRPCELGTSAPTKRHIVDRRTNPCAASISLSTTDRTNRAIHTHIATAKELWGLVAEAAIVASTDKSTCASRTLWLNLDPPLVSKSAAVKAAVQALCLDLLLPPPPPPPPPPKQHPQDPQDPQDPPPPPTKLSARLTEWVSLAREVALGSHALFAQGARGWDEGLHPETHKPLRTEQGALRVSKESYWPFETYDRTLENPLYAHCFGDSKAQSRRSRVRLVDPEGKPAVKWRAAEVAHRKMLDMEAKHELFRPRDALSGEADDSSGLTTAELGGLFLLTNLSDNWAKRTELFDLGFWTLRVVHFGLERNLGLRINQFSIDTLATLPSASPHSSPQSPPLSEQLLRHSFPDPMRSRCWLENALHCIVALKVHLFLKMRWSAYDGHDNPESEKRLTEQVIIDRHDIEQSKAHWLPSARPKSTQTSPLGPSKPVPPPKDVDLPPLAPLPPQAVAVSDVVDAACDDKPPIDGALSAVPALHAVLHERLCQHGTPVSGREALAILASERFLVLKRVEYLDRVVGMHLSVRRLLEHERERQGEVAIATLAELTAKMEAPGLSKSEASRLSTKFDAISKKFSLDASGASVITGVKRRVQSHGLKLLASDRVWSTHARCEVVAKLAAVGIPGPQTVSVDGHAVLGPDEEFVSLFGSMGLAGSLSTNRCDPIDGYARTEALVLLDRLCDIVKSEAAIQSRLRSLSALVPIPLACHADVALSNVQLGLPQRLPHASFRRYAHLCKKQQERGTSLKAMVDACATVMAKAIECAFTACLSECSEFAESDVDEEDAEAVRASQLKMPERLYACQRRVASEAMHRFLNVVHIYNGLRTVHDDDLPDDDDDDDGREPCPPILVYNATSGQLSMPDSRAVVERHWTAAQHLLDLAVVIEPWIRDRRRRLGTLLRPEEHLVTLSPDKGVCVHSPRRAVACARLDAAEEDQRTRYWPTWPPAECDLITPERVDTVVKWGRHTAMQTLMRSAVPRQNLPPEPYRHTSPGAPRAVGAHVWLHRVHERLTAADVATPSHSASEEEEEEEEE